MLERPRAGGSARGPASHLISPSGPAGRPSVPPLRGVDPRRPPGRQETMAIASAIRNDSGATHARTSHRPPSTIASSWLIARTSPVTAVASSTVRAARLLMSPARRSGRGAAFWVSGVAGRSPLISRKPLVWISLSPARQFLVVLGCPFVSRRITAALGTAARRSVGSDPGRSVQDLTGVLVPVSSSGSSSARCALAPPLPSTGLRR